MLCILTVTTVGSTRYLGNSFITCTDQGNCKRSDNVQLQLGWVPKIPLKNFVDVFDTNAKSIISINPFSNSTSLSLIRGSSVFTCADGVSECFNSCCSNGFCNDPINVCTIALKSHDSLIYSTCICYAALTIFYWVIFGYLGARYSKKMTKIVMVDHQENLINQTGGNNELNKSKAGSALENFEDEFNSGMFKEEARTDKRSVFSGNIDPKSYSQNPARINEFNEFASKLGSNPKELEQSTRRPLEDKPNPSVIQQQQKKSFLDNKASSIEDLYYKNKEADAKITDIDQSQDGFEIKEL